MRFVKDRGLPEGTDVQGRPESRRLRACRIVTTSLTAQILLANQLRSLNEFDWTVVSGDQCHDAPDGTTTVVIPMRRHLAWSDLRSFARLWRFLKLQQFDLVQISTPKASFLGLPAARLAGSATVYSIHGARFFTEYGRVSNVLGWCLERWCCAWATTVLVQSHEDETVLPRAHICSTRKLRDVGNGIVIDRFLVPVERAIASDRPVVLMVSRLVREKGIADFICLANQLSARADFVHVGWFDHERSDALSIQEVASVSRSGIVRFIGGVPDVRPYLSSAAVVVLPSYREGISRVAMEGAAMGRPVVGYDIRGVREVISRDLGLLAPCGDVGALAGFVRKMIDDPGLGDELGKCCRERVTEQFSEDDVIDRLRCLYADLGKDCRVTDRSARDGRRREQAPQEHGCDPLTSPRTMHRPPVEEVPRQIGESRASSTSPRH
jgi:glycosyltransferase involved in cell wall biosynthesis